MVGIEIFLFHLSANKVGNKAYKQAQNNVHWRPIQSVHTVHCLLARYRNQHAPLLSRELVISFVLPVSLYRLSFPFPFLSFCLPPAFSLPLVPLFFSFLFCFFRLLACNTVCTRTQQHSPARRRK